MARWSRSALWAMPAACLIGAGIAAVSSAYGGSTVALIFLLAATLVAPVVWRWTRGGLDIFEPIVIFCGIGLVYWVGKSAYILFRNFQVMEYFPWPEERVEYLNLAIIYAIIGSLCAFAGYFLLPVRRRDLVESEETEWLAGRMKLAVVVLFTVAFLVLTHVVWSAGGILSYIIQLPARGRMWEGKSYLTVPVVWPQAAVLIWYVYLLSQRRRSGVFWLAAALAGAYALALGGRAGLILLVAYLLIARHYLRRQVRLRWLIIVALAALVFITFGAYVRSQAMPEFTFVGFWDGLYGTTVDVVENFMVIVKNVPSRLSYRLGSTYLAALVGPIPRSMFPAKPYGAGGVFTSQLYPGFWESRSTLAPGILGELYLNFGPAGVVLGMLLYGAAIRLAYERLAPFRARGRPAAVVTYSLLMPVLQGAPVEFFLGVSVVMFPLVPALLTLRFCTKRAASRE